jgi:hypothetical protein
MNKKQFEAEQLMDSVRDTDENGLYDGEFEYNRNKMIRQNELYQFSDSELWDEIFRRQNEPIHLALAELKKGTDNLREHLGIAPF